ncbi:MAG: MdtA/MuxA family multidrug efflux RND transporter periplasmic adaptor subunit [Verrucomicrobia bacterium]|nr:MdtA/MuxA family multidrug efflux RND transporter periplasmic adaptor subunit [Verrucomicrobiota bacterium]
MPHPQSSFRWFLYSAVALVFAGGVWYFGFRAEAPKSGGGSYFRSSKSNAQPVPVKAEAAQPRDLSVHLRAIGTVVPLNIVTVRSRVDGQLLRVPFSEGQEVTAGQLLAEIDPLPYQLRLTQMEGQLRLSESQLRTVRSDLERFKVLHAQTLISPQQLEAQQALVAEREGALATAQAQVEDARRQLAYTKVEAPIAGRLGLRQVDAGNIVRAGDAGGMVVITQTRPISVMFTIPEIELQKVVEPLRAGEQLVVEAWDRNEGVVLATGSLKTVDNQIDLATGTLRLKAEFANTDEKLFPNQFVNVRLRVRTLKAALVIPSVAVQYGSRGTYVYVVNAENKATVRDIVLGPSDGAQQSITKGLQSGDLVVLEGLDRLREGRAVSVVSDDPAKAAHAPGGEGAAKGDGAKKKKKKE